MKKDKEKNVVEKQSTDVPKKKSKKGLIISIIIASILVVAGTIAGLLYAFVFSVKTVDLSECLKVEYKGYDGYATATVEIDQNKLKDKVKDSSVAKDFVKKAKLEVNNTTNLSNGDEIEVKVSISDSFLEQNKIKLKDKKVKVPVSGLEEAKELDAFKDMKVNLSGMSPNLSLSVTNESTDEFVKTVRFRAEKTSGIANGDTIKITAYDWDKEMAEEKGYVLKELTTDFKVENQPSYVSSKDELEGNIKGQIKSIFVEKARSKGNDSKSTVYYNTGYKYVNADDIQKDLTVGEPEVVSLYLLTKKADKSTYDANKLIGIVRVPFTSAKSGVTYNWYITVIAKNISISEGKVSENTVYDVDKYDGDDEDKAYQYFVNSQKDNFDVVNVPIN